MTWRTERDLLKYRILYVVTVLRGHEVFLKDFAGKLFGWLVSSLIPVFVVWNPCFTLLFFSFLLIGKLKSTPSKTEWQKYYDIVYLSGWYFNIKLTCCNHLSEMPFVTFCHSKTIVLRFCMREEKPSVLLVFHLTRVILLHLVGSHNQRWLQLLYSFFPFGSLVLQKLKTSPSFADKLPSYSTHHTVFRTTDLCTAFLLKTLRFFYSLKVEPSISDQRNREAVV